MNGITDNKGFVYILVNPAFTGFVKVGKTIKDPEIRARELSSSSGVPAPYAVAWDAFVNDCSHVEKLIHQQLAHSRSRNDREFFAIPLKNAIAIASKVVAPFSCEPNVPLYSINEIPHSEKQEIKQAKNSRQRQPREELIEVAEDYQERYAIEPPEGTPKRIPRIEYELLIANPYKFTERELFYEVHVVYRKRTDLKIESYNIKRSSLVQSFGWGIHRNKEGKLALVAMESTRYRELQATINTAKSYRKSKA